MLFIHSNFCWECKHNWNFSQTRLKNVSALKDDNLVNFMTINLNCSASSYRCKLIFTIKERKLWMWREAIKSSIGKYKQGQGTMECFPAIQQKHRNNQSLRFIENTPQLQVHCEFKIKATSKRVIQEFLKVFHLHRFCPKMPYEFNRVQRESLKIKKRRLKSSQNWKLSLKLKKLLTNFLLAWSISYTENKLLIRQESVRKKLLALQ